MSATARELCHRGLYIELATYKCHVFLDFHEVQADAQNRIAELAARLGAQGVPSITDALTELAMQPVLIPYRELVNPGMLGWLIQNRLEAATFTPTNFAMAQEEIDRKALVLLEAVQKTTASEAKLQPFAAEMRAEIKVLLSISAFGRDESANKTIQGQMYRFLQSGPGGKTPLAAGTPGDWGAMLACLVTYRLGRAGSAVDAAAVDLAAQSCTWLDDWLLGKIIARTLQAMGLSEAAAVRQSDLIRILTRNQDWFDPKAAPAALASGLLNSWMEDKPALRYLLVHSYGGVQWFNKEAFEELVWWTFALQVVRFSATIKPAKAAAKAKKPAAPDQPLQLCYAVVEALLEASAQSGYQLEKLVSVSTGKSVGEA